MKLPVRPPYLSCSCEVRAMTESSSPHSSPPATGTGGVQAERKLPSIAASPGWGPLWVGGGGGWLSPRSPWPPEDVEGRPGGLQWAAACVGLGAGGHHTVLVLAVALVSCWRCCGLCGRKLCAPPHLAQAFASLTWGGPEGRSPPASGAPDPDWQGLCSGCSTSESEGTDHCTGPAGSWRQGRPPLGSYCCRLVRPVLPDRVKLGRAVRVQPRGPCLHGIKGGAGPSGQWEEEEDGYFPVPLPGSGWALGWCQGQEHLAVAWLREDASGQARGAKGPPGRVRIAGQESGWLLACCTQRRTRVVRGETSAGSVQPGSRSPPSSSWWEGLLRAVPSDQP